MALSTTRFGKPIRFDDTWVQTQRRQWRPGGTSERMGEDMFALIAPIAPIALIAAVLIVLGLLEVGRRHVLGTRLEKELESLRPSMEMPAVRNDALVSEPTPRDRRRPLPPRVPRSRRSSTRPRVAGLDAHPMSTHPELGKTG